MSTIYEYSKSTEAYVEAIKRDIDDSSMTQTGKDDYEWSSWSEDDEKLYISFTDALVSGDKTILDGIVSSLPARPTGETTKQVSSEGTSATTSDSWADKLELALTSVPAGVYQVIWYFEAYSSSSTTTVDARVLSNGSDVLCEKSAVELPQATSGSAHHYIGDGDHTFKIQWQRGDGNGTVYIRRARLECRRES
jgi:hypothetical protein